MVWFIAGVFLLITVLLLAGKGSFLIAGYNTASKNEKMQYDEKKLCRVMGSGTGVITFFFMLLGYFEDNPPMWLIVTFPIVIILVVVTMIILTNTICKAKGFVPVKETEEDKSHKLTLQRWIAIIVITAFIGIGVMLVTGDVKVTDYNNEIRIEGSYWRDYKVAIETIEAISYREDFHVGGRTSGLGSFKLNEGNFKNDEFGAYILYAYTKCDSFIILDTTNRTVVVNAETPEETRELYEDLKTVVNK